MKLGTWNKPNSTETRVYFNGLHDAAANGVKVFAIETDSDRFEVRFSGNIYPNQKDAILDRIDHELEEMNSGNRVLRFSELKNLAH